eukprot:jgi/Ulvmu1/1134/UM107_0007.1
MITLTLSCDALMPVSCLFHIEGIIHIDGILDFDHHKNPAVKNGVPSLQAQSCMLCSLYFLPRIRTGRSVFKTPCFCTDGCTAARMAICGARHHQACSTVPAHAVAWLPAGFGCWYTAIDFSGRAAGHL